MSNSPSSEQLHRLVLLYLAVTYGQDRTLHPREEAAIVHLVQRWVPRLSGAQVRSVVTTALTAYRGGTLCNVDCLAASLAEWLDEATRLAVLADLGRVARADGVLSLEEAATIRRIRSVWKHGLAWQK
ncbi:MAG: TerB family tellurite resistance protein [Bacteroidota bacterium]